MSPYRTEIPQKTRVLGDFVVKKVQEKWHFPRKNLAPEAAMYKRKLNPVTIFEDPAMFGGSTAARFRSAQRESKGGCR